MGISSAIREHLPPLRRYEEIELGQGDVLVHAPGFEDRTMAILDSIGAARGARALLLDYRPYNRKNRLSAIRSGLAAAGVEVNDDDIVTYDRFSPGDFESRLVTRLLFHNARRLVVNISTMSKLAIILVLQVCCRLQLETRVIYIEADSYGPSKEEFETARERNEIHRPTLQVFSGVHGVVRANSLSSIAMQGQPTAALVFMSFNDALTQVLLNTVYPGRLFLINGRPPVHDWREAATAWIHDQVRREWEEDNPVGVLEDCGVPLPTRVASTLDYRESVGVLLELYWQLSAAHRVLLAPSGSKMQAVGCFLVKALHPDIHVEYPSPEGFAPTYSSGVAARWLLDLGVLSERLTRIAKEERREYLEVV